MGKRLNRALGRISLFFITATFIFQLFAQNPSPSTDQTISEELLVEATKDDLPLRSLGQNAVVIGAEEIQRRQWTQLAQVIRDLPGVSLTSNGGEGTVTTAFVRGAKSENTLVLLDGVKLNDPSTPGRVVDFAHLSTLGVVRIEYLAGPQSALYGSDAASGVINIITSAATGASDHSPGTWLEAGAQVGSGETGRVEALYRQSFGGLQFDVQAQSRRSKQNSVGFHPHIEGSAKEKDGYENTTARVGLGWRGEKLDLRLHADWSEGTVDSDLFPFDLETFQQGFSDDPDNRYRSRSFGQAFDLGYDLWNGRLRQEWQLSSQSHERVEWNGPLPIGDFPYENRYDGDLTKLEWRNRLQVGQHTRLLLGLDHEREEAKNPNADAASSGIFSQLYASLGRWDLVLGARYQDHDRFGGHDTHQASLVWRVGERGTRLRVSYGSAFKAPSLGQLFDPFYGNAELDPEESRSYEVGLGQDLGERGDFDLSYYDSAYDNLVDFLYDPASGGFAYGNQPDARMAGLETRLSWRFDGWGVRLSYDRLFHAESRGASGAEWTDLIRRAKQKANLGADGRLGKRLSWDLNLLYYGESQDHDFFTNEYFQKLDAYSILDLAVAYDWGNGIRIEMKVENLTDETSTQVIGYEVPGARGLLGMRILR